MILSSCKISPNPLSSLSVTCKYISAHGLIPNTSLQNRPLLHYHCAFPPASSTPSALEFHVTEVGVVEPHWRYTMYSTTHFHSTTHEVLAIASGSAVCCFGGEENPERYEPLLQQGDVIVVPAGVGHRLIAERETPFQMVGCYPKGKQWDMCYGTEREERKIQGIKSLGWFEKDPIYGEEGPVLESRCSKVGIPLGT